MEKQIQISGRTALNRRPREFRRAAELRPDARDVLSFGCSTGEEVASLKKYFPDACALGTEIPAASLAQARLHFPQFEFLSPAEMGGRQFDVIFAMSVLCLWPDKGGYLDFELFTEACEALYMVTFLGGLFVS